MPHRTTAQRGYGYAHQAASRRLRAEHVARWGWWCPGLDTVPAHPSADLVADHLVAGDAGKGLQVICRGCNSRLARGWR